MARPATMKGVRTLDSVRGDREYEAKNTARQPAYTGTVSKRQEYKREASRRNSHDFEHEVGETRPRLATPA